MLGLVGVHRGIDQPASMVLKFLRIFSLSPTGSLRLPDSHAMEMSRLTLCQTYAKKLPQAPLGNALELTLGPVNTNEVLR
jgi:hypothetical protein